MKSWLEKRKTQNSYKVFYFWYIFRIHAFTAILKSLIPLNSIILESLSPIKNIVFFVKTFVNPEGVSHILANSGGEDPHIFGQEASEKILKIWADNLGHYKNSKPTPSEI